MRIHEIAALMNTMNPDARDAAAEVLRHISEGKEASSKEMAVLAANLQKAFLETEVPKTKPIGDNPSPGRGPIANRPKKKNKGEDDSVSVDVKGPTDA